jgi:signal transduction histidine kinase
MRERAALAGGTLEISGEKGQGTLVSLSVPVGPKGARA